MSLGAQIVIACSFGAAALMLLVCVLCTVTGIAAAGAVICAGALGFALGGVVADHEEALHYEEPDEDEYSAPNLHIVK